MTDPTPVRRVLDNLIRNACEASRPGDVVTVTVRSSDGGGTAIAVRNRSVPPPAITHRMFSRAVSTKGAGRGHGTRSVLVLTERYLRGRVDVDFTHGTTVTVTLPASLRRAGPGGPGSGRSSVPPG